MRRAMIGVAADRVLQYRRDRPPNCVRKGTSVRFLSLMSDASLTLRPSLADSTWRARFHWLNVHTTPSSFHLALSMQQVR